MGPGELKELHRAMKRECSRLLPTRVHVAPVSRPEWEKTPANNTCDFELFPDNWADGEHAFRGRTKTKRKVSVLSLHPQKADSPSCYWISWYEQWRRDDKSGFDLLTASWTVYRGIRAQPDKAQLVRADWDQHAAKTSRKDAQPHWHFDQPVAVSAAMLPAASTLSLQEVQSLHTGSPMGVFPTIGEMKVDHVHLAMGTWEAKKAHPECWQREAQTWPDISIWAIRTLEYLQDQFRRR